MPKSVEAKELVVFRNLIEDILDKTNYGTIRELRYQLTTLTAGQGHPLYILTDIIQDVCRGPR